ncbi:MAG: hypothetical protein AAF393_01190 [Pseudomonadota bacterium]
MIKGLFTAAVLGALSTLPSFVAAAETRTLFRKGSWQVKVVAFDDAQIKCEAQVVNGNSSFSIWADGINAARLQFYDRDWTLGQGSADVIVRIDRRPKWDLSNARLNKQSVLFDLPNDRDGNRFIGEVRNGRVVYLGSAGGREVGRWSLSGSSAAVGALIDCVDLIRDRGDGNPFN